MSTVIKLFWYACIWKTTSHSSITSSSNKQKWGCYFFIFHEYFKQINAVISSGTDFEVKCTSHVTVVGRGKIECGWASIYSMSFSMSFVLIPLMTHGDVASDDYEEVANAQGEHSKSVTDIDGLVGVCSGILISGYYHILHLSGVVCIAGNNNIVSARLVRFLVA